MKFDLHTHTRQSEDAGSSFRSILKRAKTKGLDGIAVTNHETFFDPDKLKLSMDTHIWIISGEEVHTEIGDIIALFISKPVIKRYAEEVINEVHSQGGIVVLAHPFKRICHYPISILERIDAVEIVNARWMDIRIWASRPDVSQLLDTVKGRTAGSDAHFSFEIGNAYWETPHLDSPEALKDRICRGTGRSICQTSTQWPDILSQCVKFYRTPSPKQFARIFYWALKILATRLK